MRTTLLWLVLVVLTAACGQSQPSEITPPEIRYGEDVCESCGMIISEPRYASACVTSDSKDHKFDDIGDMLTFYHDQPDSVAQCFVHDYETEAWIKANDAIYVVGAGIRTPMGFGMVAFTHRAQAETFAQDNNAATYTYDELMKLELNPMRMS